MYRIIVADNECILANLTETYESNEKPSDAEKPSDDWKKLFQGVGERETDILESVSRIQTLIESDDIDAVEVVPRWMIDGINLIWAEPTYANDISQVLTDVDAPWFVQP